eukprot:1015027_1
MGPHILKGHCWNCEQPGHKSYECPSPIKQCPQCKHIGHNTPDQCKMYWQSKTIQHITSPSSSRPETPGTAVISIFDEHGNKIAKCKLHLHHHYEHNFLKK